MPLLPLETYDPIIESIGRLYSKAQPHVLLLAEPIDFLTEEDLLREQILNDKKAAKLSEDLDLSSWVAINQLITLPIEAWIGGDDWTKRFGIHPLIKKAIALEVEKVVAKVNSDRNEQERKLAMEKAELNQKFNYGTPNTSFQRVFH